MYGVGAVKYKDFVVGYIEKNSFDMGGQKPESAKIEAEQVPGTPVLIIPQSNGSIAPTFNVIQLNYENLHSLLGGTMHYKEEDSEKKTPRMNGSEFLCRTSKEMVPTSRSSRIDAISSRPSALV